MWKAAGNNLITLAGPNRELTVDTTAANPLFTVVPGGGGPAKIASFPFARFHALLVDFQAHPFTPSQAHINDFLNALAQAGGPVEAAYNYLRGGGFLPVRLGVNNLQDFRALLKDMWFTGSTGFEHVFVGEQYSSNGKQFYKGFHNWYQFMVEQGRLQTTGIKQGISYLPDAKPAFLSKLKFNWRGAVKNPGSSMFAGTSPAFDLAMFSTCFIRGMHMAAPFVNNKRLTDCDCHIDAGGKRNKVEIKTVEKSTNADKVLTAYPTKVQSFEICLGNALLKRLDCGYLGITRQECEGNRDCCWDDTVHGVNWCFRSEPDLADRCRSIDVPKRVDCGWVGITEAQCLAKNCCWDDLKYNSPSKHCFNPSGP